jgi:hypothetical protein
VIWAKIGAKIVKALEATWRAYLGVLGCALALYTALYIVGFVAENWNALASLALIGLIIYGAKSIEAKTQELRRSCPLFADRMQESDKQTALGQAW